MIYKFKPFSVTKQLGEEYNAHCSLVPNDEDWILLMDYDTMILCPETYGVIERAINTNPMVEIFSAWTNRIGYRHQRYGNPLVPDVNSDIKQHIILAKNLAREYCFGSVIPITTAAGFFLLFRKSYWKAVGGFQKGIRDGDERMFDYNFCLPAQRRGTIALIRGVYVWHTYRLMQEDYRYTDHLK